jgi:hypothetical protein
MKKDFLMLKTSLNQIVKVIARFLALTGFFILVSYSLKAQMNDRDADTSFANMAAGEFTPGAGFQLVKTKYASLNLSFYGMARYLNQMSPDTTWQDHLGNTKDFIGRNDIYWHRAMVWFSGFAIDPRLTYQITVWTVMSTQQTLVYGNLQYAINKHIKLGVGITPNACIRSIQGLFPFFASTDRTMAEEALRAGFTTGVFATGEITPRLRYTAVLGNNLSILGVKANNLKRHFSQSFSLNWMPTTGEFGPRGGIGDFEHHEKLATRFGASYTHYRDNRFFNVSTPAPDNTQVRM